MVWGVLYLVWCFCGDEGGSNDSDCDMTVFVVVVVIMLLLCPRLLRCRSSPALGGGVHI